MSKSPFSFFSLSPTSSYLETLYLVWGLQKNCLWHHIFSKMFCLCLGVGFHKHAKCFVTAYINYSFVHVGSISPPLSLWVSLDDTDPLWLSAFFSSLYHLSEPLHPENHHLPVGGWEPCSDSLHVFPNPYSPPGLFSFPARPILLESKASKRDLLIWLNRGRVPGYKITQDKNYTC